jgi:5-methylcytosine-specific restriction endonuclease McrA
VTDVDRFRGSARYQKARTAFYRSQGPFPPCSICGGPIDMSLSGRHRDGRSIDHRVPASSINFWELTNWTIAHRRCNSSKGKAVPLPGPGSPPDRVWCWEWVGSDGWQRASPNGLTCDVEGPNCPHFLELRAKYTRIGKEN